MLDTSQQKQYVKPQSNWNHRPYDNYGDNYFNMKKQEYPRKKQYFSHKKPARAHKKPDKYDNWNLEEQIMSSELLDSDSTWHRKKQAKTNYPSFEDTTTEQMSDGSLAVTDSKYPGFQENENRPLHNWRFAKPVQSYNLKESHVASPVLNSNNIWNKNPKKTFKTSDVSSSDDDDSFYPPIPARPPRRSVDPAFKSFTLTKRQQPLDVKFKPIAPKATPLAKNRFYAGTAANPVETIPKYHPIPLSKYPN
jgi:hypothetical protein